MDMNRKKHLPKYYSVSTIKINSEFLSREMKVIFTQEGIFYPLLNYFIENQYRSIPWQNNLTLIVGMFIDYTYSNKDTYLSNKNKIFFMPDFIHLVQYGSINEQGKDELGLYWCPKKINRVNILINTLYSFLDWFYKKSSNDNSFILINYNELELNKKVLFWRHWSKRKYTSLLSHIKKPESYNFKKIIFNNKNSFFKSNLYDVKHFENSKLLDLLFIGFKKNKIYDIRNIMITMLMHFGGCRLSEPFHLFIDDIQEDPNNKGYALVKLFHPEDGAVRYYDKYFNTIIESTRKEYLLKKYNTVPRNLQINTLRAGWKDLALDKTGKDNYSIIYWFPNWAGKLFWNLYKLYITKIRPKNLSHPFLFTNLQKKSFGQPYTINAFIDSHRAAVKKIGLTYKKEFGTTPHSHRHAFGQNLQNSNIDKNIIQKALHHKSPLSQMIYTMPSIEIISQKLNEASSNISKNILVEQKEEDFFIDIRERFLNDY